MTGKNLGHYRIGDRLGAGGMGVVYRAHDTHLDRAVAVKLLQPAAMADPERKKRFTLEARSASSLQHPNIVTIYDIATAEVDGQMVDYIAMEFVTGNTLGELIPKKGMRFRDGLKYAIQIASGLAAAHNAGIVHRDLKPSNIMVTDQGLVKILDFGLAKLAESRPADARAATESLHLDNLALSREGAIVGTAAYMSPEQAEGKRLDARSDIFSFGSLLYEMFTGCIAFTGESTVSTLSAVLLKEPKPARSISEEIPRDLEHLINRCLKKEADRRWQSSADLKVALEEILEDSHLAPPETVSRQPLSRRLMLVGAGAVAGLGSGAWLASRFWRQPPPQIQRITFRRGDVLSARFAPGGMLVYSAIWDGSPPATYSAQPGNREARLLDLPSAKIVSITPGGEALLLLGGSSADSRGTLARVPLGGGAHREILEMVATADWAPDGESIAVTRTLGLKHRLEYPIGKVLLETEGRPFPRLRVSHDGALVAFFEFDAEIGDYAISIVSASKRKQILSRGWRAVGDLSWSPSGKEIWFSAARPGADPALFAVDMSGAERVVTQEAGFVVLHDVSRDGRVLYSTVNTRVGILFHDKPGSEVRDMAWLDASVAYELTDDGKTLLFSELSYGEGRNVAIYIRPTSGAAAVKLGFGNRPSLSRDGKTVACIKRDADGTRILLLPTGAGESRLIESGPIRIEAVEWSPDGSRLLVAGNEPGKPLRSFFCDLETGKLTAATDPGLRATRVSPDGKTLLLAMKGKLHTRGVAGGPLQPLADLAPGQAVSRWSSDGRYIFLWRNVPGFRRIDRLEAATGRKQPWMEFKLPNPHALFIGQPALSGDGSAAASSFQHDMSNLYMVTGLR
ncbi:MAG: serine/threonine-protein kinase [Acidimicrobiia bacterium]|nr:serine/threonine-protein kinase [Acidimicrobiia bacterium]